MMEPISYVRIAILLVLFVQAQLVQIVLHATQLLKDF